MRPRLDSGPACAVAAGAGGSARRSPLLTVTHRGGRPDGLAPAAATTASQVLAVVNCSAVVGSITLETRFTLSAGKPALRACSRINASFSAM